jgi:protein TonB
METNGNKFDDIVFAKRNKTYGAYFLRKVYNKHLTIGIVIGVTIMLILTITPYLRAKMNKLTNIEFERNVEFDPFQFKKPIDEQIKIPETPKESPKLKSQVAFVPPKIVDDEIEEGKGMITDAEAKDIIENENVTELKIVEKEPVIEEVAKEDEVFVTVEEMPVFPGGDLELIRFIANNVDYPEQAREANIQGKVYVRFCVTSKGNVDKVSIARGVHSLLDEEAMRVVKKLPKWIPGKQRGVPVSVWYTVPINFRLSN